MNHRDFEVTRPPEFTLSEMDIKLLKHEHNLLLTTADLYLRRIGVVGLNTPRLSVAQVMEYLRTAAMLPGAHTVSAA